MALLPGHSAQRVANYVREIGIKDNEWQRILMYSWLEFDGLMFVTTEWIDRHTNVD